MENKEQVTKCVMVINSELPLGLIANTAAVLALTLGKRIEGIIGPDVLDGSGNYHIGITTTPIPILKSDSEGINVLRDKVATKDFFDLLVVDFSNAAQTTTTYEVYTEKISKLTTNDLEYLGVAIYGDRKKVNKLTGSMPLLR
ncbi:hypothetical protein JOC70_002203 [Clostridium pascui]|uniref:DUF2000 domain-containing protein n=1 Tax=Clostridium pascui TaxID=46609 RepID=UPI00195A03C4|nr:DUF2000 domain-containing protein [Clostridium pascui]MBM7870709.1 hypothetical protein [Clostridium pascui]